jgi:lactate permease
MHFLFAIFPFVALLILMALFNRPAFIATPVVAFFTALGLYIIWGVPVNWVAVAFIKGFSVTIEIMLIISGAIFLVAVIKKLNLFEPLKELFASVSKDKRIQAILVAWFFVSFIEGVAGFGTPALLAIPILIALGFKPFTSVVLGLVGDSAAVVFGAVGVPITIGIAEGVGLPSDMALSLSSEVANGAALLNLILSPVVPFFIAMIVSRECFGSWIKGFEVWKFTIASGVAMMLPSLVTAYWLTLELPSIIGALIGGFVMLLFLQRGWFTPQNVRVFNEEDRSVVVKQNIPADYVKLCIPYILVVLLLLVTRLPMLPFGDWLRSIVYTSNELLNTTISVSLNIWYSPGVIFFFVGLIMLAIYDTKMVTIGESFKELSHRIKMPFIGLFFVLAIVQLMLLSYYNSAGLPSMPIYIAEQLAIVGKALPFFAPFVGVMGAFIAGSSTVSNLLFASLQYTTASAVGISVVLALSLQATGSAIGNMVAVHNILAAETVAGIKNKEGKILRMTIIPAFIYSMLLGIIGLLATLFF